MVSLGLTQSKYSLQYTYVCMIVVIYMLHLVNVHIIHRMFNLNCILLVYLYVLHYHTST